MPALDAMVLVLAPGLAFVPLLPARLRAHSLAVLAALPTLGIALSMVALVTASRLGLPIDGTWVRVLEGALALVGLLALRGPDLRGPPPSVLEVLGLVGALAAGAVLGGRVVSGFPVPGNDWAKYVLYADEIRRQGSLLIDNPFWMLGVPSARTRACPPSTAPTWPWPAGSAVVVVHGIWILMGTTTATVFAYARTFWGAAAGVIAAALFGGRPDRAGHPGLARRSHRGGDRAHDPGPALRDDAARRRPELDRGHRPRARRHRAGRRAPPDLRRRRPGLRCGRGHRAGRLPARPAPAAHRPWPRGASGSWCSVAAWPPT